MIKEEFKVPDGEGGLAETFFNPEREGWLTKEGGKYKSKHRRWFILKEGMLYYFKQPQVSFDLSCVEDQLLLANFTSQSIHQKYL